MSYYLCFVEYEPVLTDFLTFTEVTLNNIIISTCIFQFHSGNINNNHSVLHKQYITLTLLYFVQLLRHLYLHSN